MRSQQDPEKEFQSLRMTAGGNGPHDPDPQAAPSLAVGEAFVKP
jgi:hypothetical protein